MHLSPLKLNITFSLSGGEDELAQWTGVRDVIIVGDLVRHLVASVGVIADVRDADVRCLSYADTPMIVRQSTVISILVVFIMPDLPSLTCTPQ